MQRNDQPGSLASRLLWFAVLWFGGVATVAVIALLVRAVLQ